jgi:hypothetical protein
MNDPKWLKAKWKYHRGLYFCMEGSREGDVQYGIAKGYAEMLEKLGISCDDSELQEVIDTGDCDIVETEWAKFMSEEQK